MGTQTEPHLDQHILVGAHLLSRGHEWVSEAGDNHKLVFHPDGTGEMISQADGVIALVAGIDWRIVSSAGSSKQHGTRPVPIPVILRSGPILQPPQKAFEGTLEITINRQRPLLDGKVVNYRLIDDKLLPTAFQTRKIPFIVESGEFYLPRARTFHGLRMTFSPSPYPLRETWRPDERVMVETMKLCGLTQFCARPLARKIDPAEEGSRGGCVLM
ncbi:hypothetical protein C8R47DRAFT_289507 [Mycena vitilis]|nr:hypothetical protein C8R47DRAFT_289507 [Mycena vitilis]